MFSFEGLSLMLLNFLRIPPGTSIRKNSPGSGSADFDQYIEQNELIQSVVDITVNDVVIGRSPFTYLSKDGTPHSLKVKVEEQLIPEFNKIAKWAARDLLTKGYSIYETEIYDDKFTLIPVIDDCEFYIDKRGNIIVYRITEDGRSEKSENLQDIIVFLNYDKSSFANFEDSDKELKNKGIKFAVTPTPIQLKNVAKTAKDLYDTEQSILRYRTQLSRILRFVTVDIGVSQGDQQQTVIDEISSALNSNSLSLPQTTELATSYDDNIPVIPTRRGIGRPELTESVPSADISNTEDLDKIYQKLFLGLKFPKSYAMFDEALGSSAVSTIRGDIRYNRMVTDCRTLIEETVNKYLWTNRFLKKWEVEFQLSGMPSSEDEDIISALAGYHDFLSDMFDLIVTNSETSEEAVTKVTLMSDLMGKSTNIPNLSKFLDDLRLLIKNHKFDGDEEGLEDDNEHGEPGGGFEDIDFGESDFEPVDFGSDEEASEDETGEPDFEVEGEDLEEAPNLELNG